jgi:hypothetical protein
VLRVGGELTGVLGGPEEAKVVARRRHSPEELIEHADVVILGAEDAARRARALLEAGKHVSVAVPIAGPAPASRTLLKLAHVARTQSRVLHLFEPSLCVPGMRTLRGHARPGEIRQLAIEAASTAPTTDANGLVRAHHAAFDQVVTVGGRVLSVLEVTRVAGRIDAVLEMNGFRATLTLTDGQPAADLDLKVNTELKWRLQGMHLYCGSSMTTLTDNRSPSELAVLELTQMLDPSKAPGGVAPRPTLPVEAHYHALLLAEALAEGRSGPVDRRSDAAS